MSGTVRLLDVEPELGRYLTAADAEVLDGLPVPVIGLGAGDLELAEVLAAHHAFAGIVLEGLLVRRIAVGEDSTLILIGPGDFVPATLGSQSILVTARSWRASAPATIALLERQFLLGAHRAPRLVAGLHARTIEQAERVAVQLAICQLPRVEERILALLWHLAECWGQVTADGTALRLQLTHETIGGLVGARRSTVTLALGQLREEGAIRREKQGLLLLKAPVHGVPRPTRDPGPQVLGPLPPSDKRLLGAMGLR
jgi:CRP/FNR family transcriptional regulator, cyclic AMP receptor protein